METLWLSVEPCLVFLSQQIQESTANICQFQGCENWPDAGW